MPIIPDKQGAVDNLNWAIAFLTRGETKWAAEALRLAIFCLGRTPRNDATGRFKAGIDAKR